MEVLHATTPARVRSEGGKPPEQDTESKSTVSVKESAESSTDCRSGAGISVHVTTVEASIASAIRQTMISTGSNLLVLNVAQHGMWWNLIGKSTTVNEIKGTPYSLLIMRDPL